MTKQHFYFSLIMLLCTTACGSFESVTSTAKMAQHLEDHKRVYETNPCVFDLAFNDQEKAEQRCRDYQDLDTVRAQAVELIVNYGMALERIAKNSTFSGADEVEMVLNSGGDAGWISLTDNQIAGSKGLVDATFNLITNGVRLKKIKSELKNNNEAVQLVVSSLAGDLQLRQGLYGNVYRKIELYMNPDPQLDADTREVKAYKKDSAFAYAQANRLDRFSKMMVRQQMTNDTAQVAAAIKALQAFGETHDLLARNFEKIGTKEDKALMTTILNNLKEAYGGVSEFRSTASTE